MICIAVENVKVLFRYVKERVKNTTKHVCIHLFAQLAANRGGASINKVGMNSGKGIASEIATLNFMIAH